MTIMRQDSINQAGTEGHIFFFSVSLNLYTENTTVLELVQGIIPTSNKNIQLCLGVSIFLTSLLLTSTSHLLFIYMSGSESSMS